MNAILKPRPEVAPRFALGRVVATPGALRALEAADRSPYDLIARHVRGDWGDVPAEDARANEAALTDAGRVLSAYALPTGERVYVITECDRSVTTLLLPSEY